MNYSYKENMKRRKFKAKTKRFFVISFILALILSASFFAYKGFSAELEESRLAEEFDILTVRPMDYLTDETLDGFQMKTKNLKVVTEEDVFLDQTEINAIFYYCLFNKVEVLDLSDSKFFEDTIEPSVYLSIASIREVMLPEDLVKIGKCCFYEWKNLETINMPYKLEEVGPGAFSGCINLEPVNFGPNIKILGEQAFLGCEKYETVEIPETVEFLGRFCFAENKNLKSIIMPNNDTFEINGSITENPEVVIGVYYDSYAYGQLVPLTDETPIITNKNKIMIIPVVTRNNLKKTPKIKEIKNTMSIGFDENIEDFVDIDINGTGAISYKVIVNSNNELKNLKEGMNTVNYEIHYYLSDIDVSEIKTRVTKVDSIEEVFEADSTRDDFTRFFVEATKYIASGSIKIKVENHSNEISKKATELTEEYSRLLNETKHKAYMTSYVDGSFKPSVTLSRGEVAVILARINNYKEDAYYPNDFEDVPDSSWAKSAIGFVSSKGYMNGADGKFRMSDKITRAEFVIAISKMIGLEQSEDKSLFPDVWNKPGEGYIAAFEKLGIINGKENGSFGYYDEVSRAEACKIINAVTGRTHESGKFAGVTLPEELFTDVKLGDWYYADVYEATRDHYFNEFHDEK